MDFVITILSGVLIFILSQYILELKIKPRIRLNERYGILSRSMLKYHSKHINGVLSDNEIEIIKNASADLLSQAWICYKSRSKREQFLTISKEINYIVSESKLEKKNFNKIVESLKKIEKMDRNIIVTYNKHT